MTHSHSEFQQRLNVLGRKHKAMENGYVTQVRGDGLIVVKPKRARRSNSRLPRLLFLALGFFVFKGFMLASLGEVTYNERVAKLSNASTLERAGAWVMQVEPVTEFMAGFIEPLTK